MSEKLSGKTRHHPPPISLVTRRAGRSCSLNNDLQRQPTPQSVQILERRSSITSNDSKQEPRCHVADLIKRFEKSQSVEDLHHSSTDVRIPITTTKRAPSKVLVPSTSSSSLFSGPKFGTIVRHSIHQVLGSLESIEQNPYAIDTKSVEENSSNSMARVEQHSIVPPETFLKSQLVDYIKDDDQESLNSVTEKNKKILHESIKEIYNTEASYVKTLYVLAVKLPAKMKETCSGEENVLELFQTTYRPLINSIRELYRFHHGTILPCIEEYQIGRRTNHIWASFQEHFQTIENLYKVYYVAYDEYQRELKRLEKSSLIKRVHQAMLVCKVYLGNLDPISELNCPNQRLLRYILLMKNYMKHLDENSDEYEHTNFIHEEFSRIAVRCEEELVISSAQLNRLKARIDNKLEGFDQQKLLWHGSLKKQSARKRTDITQVYVILFSNCLLVYEESGSKLEFKRQLSMENITIVLMDSKQINSSSTFGQQVSSSTYYPFRVNAVEKSYEFLVERESERERWVTKIQQASEDYQYRRGINNRHSDQPLIGTRAPAWVYDLDVTRCQICQTRFGLKLIPSSRHHCRACGRCICGSCSTKKLLLKYRQKEGDTRVCDTCYTLATGVNKITIPLVKITRNPSRTILFGNFRCLSTHAIVWLELQEDFYLHIYAGKLDQVEDYAINLPELRNITLREEIRTFVLYETDKRYKYAIESNHQNDYTDEKLKNISNKAAFFTRLWFETMQIVRQRTLPLWYIQKRHSADSGISAV